MASGALPAVDKYTCSFQRWLPGHLASVDNAVRVKTIRLFATWHVIPALRARAVRSNITPSVRRNADASACEPLASASHTLLLAAHRQRVEQSQGST